MQNWDALWYRSLGLLQYGLGAASLHAEGIFAGEAHVLAATFHTHDA